MSAVVGERDRLLRATVPRNINPTLGKFLLLEVDPSAVHLDADGNATTPVITFTAVPVGFDATVLWSITTGGALSGTGKNVRTMAASSMTAESVKVTVTAVYDGQAYINVKTVYKNKDGKTGANGTSADLSPGALVAALEGRIVRSSLYADLRSTIDLIDGPDSIPTTVAGQIKKETDARIAAITKEASDRVTYVQSYTYSEQEIDNSLSVFATTITSQYKAYADAARDLAVSNSTAYVQAYAYSKSTSDSALSAMANTLRSEFATNNGVTTAYLNTYYFTQTQTNNAIANATQTLSTTVGQHTTTLQAQAQSLDGLGGQLTWKIDNNGHVSGFGLASTPINGVPYSTMIFNVDVLGVALPGGSGKTIFTVGQVNGQSAAVFRTDLFVDGAITARMIKVGSSDNILPDPQFRDLGWWGRTGIATTAQWADAGQITGWTGGSSMYLTANAGTVETNTSAFQMTPGATYLIEVQVSISNDWNGRLGVYMLIPGVQWYPMIQSPAVAATGQTWANGLPVSINGNNPTKGMVTCSSTYTVPGAGSTSASTCIKIMNSFTAGSCEIGSISITRVVDQTLIGPGSVFTKHLDIATGGDIHSGQAGFDLGDGFWLEGEGRGHGARMSIGRQNGRKIIIDPANNRLELVDPQIGANMTASVSPQQYVVLRNSNQQFNDVYGGTFTATAGNASSNLSYSWRVESTSGYVIGTISSNGNQGNVSLTGKLFTGQEIDVLIYCRITDLNNGVSREASAIVVVQTN